MASGGRRASLELRAARSSTDFSRTATPLAAAVPATGGARGLGRSLSESVERGGFRRAVKLVAGTSELLSPATPPPAEEAGERGGQGRALQSVIVTPAVETGRGATGDEAPALDLRNRSLSWAPPGGRGGIFGLTTPGGASDPPGLISALREAGHSKELRINLKVRRRELSCPVALSMMDSLLN